MKDATKTQTETSKESHLKISPYDKYQALCRSKLYRSDYKKYIEKRGNEKDWAAGDTVKLSDAAKWVCNKWDIKYPINPETTRILKIREDGMSEGKLQDESFLYSIIDPPSITFLTPPEEWQEMKTIGLKNTNDIMLTHVDGKLVLMIDTSCSYHELEKAFKEFLKQWVKPSKKRMRSDIIKWQIYDEYIKGKNLLEITHNIFKTEGSPNYNEIVDAYYQQVKRAQKKAHSIIQYLEKQTESHSTK
jgi:hypothetical protein